MKEKNEYIWPVYLLVLYIIYTYLCLSVLHVYIILPIQTFN